MKFNYFKFKNFKGIKDEELNFTRSEISRVFALVGLNESGKTTILEAINYFAYKTEPLDVLGLDNYHVEDIHNLIPINLRDNFNDRVSVQAGIELSTEDVKEIRKIFRKEHDIILTDYDRKITYTQNYYFKNSIHIEDDNEFLWTYNFKGKKSRGRIERRLTNDQALSANEYIKKNLPSILYFPNFLFEFPEKIYLENNIEDKKHIFYQQIIQDVLDSLNNDTNIEDHIINRVKSDDRNEKRNLTSLIGKMEKQLTKIVFDSWDEIFSKKISKKEIVLIPDIDDEGVFIEFYIKDDVDTYRIVERSLGFRWFFVYVLLTQLRSFRKKNKNAIFLFDEPASNLHPSAQSELLKSFENLPNVVYTTHSHYLINPKWLENTYVIKNRGIDYDNEEDYNAEDTDIQITKYREFVSKFPTQTSYFQPILEVLEFRPSNIELVPKVVLTEGKNDFYTFGYFQNIIRDDEKPINIVPGISANNLVNLISLYIGWGSQFVILLDSDEKGVEQKSRYLEDFGNALNGRIFTYKDINSKWTNFKCENLFTEEDALLMQKSVFTTNDVYSKKLFNRSIQENYATGKKVIVSEETKSNLSTTLDWLTEKLFQ